MDKPSYSQFGQDLKVLEMYNNKENGYFVEVGASDGILLSNTNLLEKKYNWTGICVEALPSYFEDLKKNRNFFTQSLLSGLASYLSNGQQITNTIKVKTITLTEILDANNAPTYIEYLSLDTEGNELEVLKGTNLDKYTFGYISVQHNWVEPNRTLMRNYLQEKNYIYVGANECDDNYIHNSFLMKSIK